MIYTRLLAMLALVAAMTGCATTPNSPQDPMEGFNRNMFSFNDTIDQSVLKPAATTYRSLVPSFVQSGVGNFFGNIGDVWTGVNNLLQGKFEEGAIDFTRVVVNSTLGIGGLFDIGSDAGLTKHKEDFGQTLGAWGIPAGPYLVLPFLGSTTVRDALALPADIAGDLWGYKYPVHVRNAGSVLRVIDQRAALLDVSNLVEEAALDRYEFVRDGFLQRRVNKINDGEDPKSKKDNSSSHDERDAEVQFTGLRPAISVEPLPTVVVQTADSTLESHRIGQKSDSVGSSTIQGQAFIDKIPKAETAGSSDANSGLAYASAATQ